jgi:CRP/FNR family transcriptional regulator, cyclic AMP receptor protein
MEFRLLQGLPQEDVRRVIGAARMRKYQKNETLFHEGDPGRSVHLITKGRLAVRVTTPLGDAATIDVLGAGDVVGELALLGGDQLRSANVVALEAVETLMLDQDAFADLRREHPDVTEILIRVLSARLRRLDEQLLEALYVPADVRVLRRLVALADLYDDQSESVTVPLTQEDLAGLAGTTRATVNRVLRREEKQSGSVSLGRGKITVVDRASLAKRAR